jgi:hypothetical protein
MPCLNPFIPTLQTQKPLYRRMGVDLGAGLEIPPPVRFEPQTILPIASYNTD